MRDKDNKKGTWPDSYLKAPFALVLGFILGAIVVGSTYDKLDDDAYRRGRMDGIQECQKPSKLERAAKWVSH